MEGVLSTGPTPSSFFIVQEKVCLQLGFIHWMMHQTVTVRNLTFLENVHSPYKCHMSCVMCQM